MSDPYHLQRFVDAQAQNYATALAEIGEGQKRTHWMWYVFPQYAGLGFSATSRYFAIASLAEARAYLEHPVLGARLRECTGAVLRIEGRSARDIFGSPDDMKLKSCATLFLQVAAPPRMFAEVLERYFNAQPDQRTLDLIGADR